MKITKRVLASILFISVLISVLVPFSVAEDYIEVEQKMSDEEKKVHKEFFDYYGTDEKEALEKQLKNGKIKQKDDSLLWYGQYLFFPSNYIEDVNNSVWVGDKNTQIDKSVIQQINKNGILRWTACFFDNEPQNQLNHNCDIPSMGTEIIQTLFGGFYKTGIHNGQITSSVAEWGFGVPKGITNVPIKEADRALKYTGLELWGYDFNYTSYYGEWDDITVQSNARIMSNVGFWNKMKVFGAGLLDGFGNLFKKVTTNFSLNPLDWLGWFTTSTMEGVVSTAVDSVDLYIVSSNRWYRPRFANTLYNTYFLSSLDLMEISSKLWKEHFKAFWLEYAKEDIAVQYFLKYVSPRNSDYYNPYFPEFPKCLRDDSCTTSDYDWEDYCRVKIVINTEGAGGISLAEGSVICAQWYTKEEFFNEKYKPRHEVYFKETLDTPKSLKKHGQELFDCYNKNTDFDEMLNCWEEPHTAYGKKVFNFNKPNMKVAMSKLRASFFEKYPHLRAQGGLGHLVCADEDGKIEDIDNIKWVYDRYNTRTQEFLSGCAVVRPSIEGAFTGTGDYTSKDSRYLHFQENSKLFMNGYGELNIFGHIAKWISVFSTKLTNTIINFSFSNILTELKLDTVITSIFEKLTKGVFFPLFGLALFITAIYLFFNYFTQSGAFFRTLGVSLSIFFLMVLVMNVPNTIIKFVDEYPSKLDETILNAIFVVDGTNKNTKTSDLVCQATGEYSVIRNLQCQVWKFGVLDPYIYNQWGTTLDNLDSSKFTNKNTNLVGKGTIDMGGHITIENWGLWQINKMKSGTITTYNTEKPVGITPKSLYKLVDLQAGPNYGELSDNRYFNNWNGMTVNRNANHLVSALTMIMFTLVIGFLGIAKIETSLLFAFKLMMLPMVALASILPNSQSKLSEHLLEMLMILIRRIFIVFILSVSLLISKYILMSNMSYWGLSLIVVIFLWTVKLYYKELIEKFTGLKEYSGVGHFISKLNPKKAIPRTLNYKISQVKAQVKGVTTGTIAGFGVGLVRKLQGKSNISDTIRDAVSASTKNIQSKTFTEERKQGFSLLTEYNQIQSKINSTARQQFKSNSVIQSNLDELVNKVNDNINDLNLKNSTSYIQGNSEYTKAISEQNELLKVIKQAKSGQTLDERYYKLLTKYSDKMEKYKKSKNTQKQQITQEETLSKLSKMQKYDKFINISVQTEQYEPSWVSNQKARNKRREDKKQILQNAINNLNNNTNKLEDRGIPVKKENYDSKLEELL